MLRHRYSWSFVVLRASSNVLLFIPVQYLSFMHDKRPLFVKPHHDSVGLEVLAVCCYKNSRIAFCTVAGFEQCKYFDYATSI